MATVTCGQVGRLPEQVAAAGVTEAMVIRYLQGSPVVLAQRCMNPDPIDPTAAPIPVNHCSDGSWVWSAAFTECVARHKMALPDDLLDRVRVHGGHAPMDLSAAEFLEALTLVGAG